MYHIFPLMCKNTFLMRKIIKSINSRYIWYSQVVKNKHTKWAQKNSGIVFISNNSKIHMCKSHFPCAKSSSCSCLPVAYIACRLYLVCRPIPRTIVLCFHHIFSQMCKNTFSMRKIIKSINSRYI